LPFEVTTPADETVAMSVSDELHVTTAPGIVAPPASFTVGVSVAVVANDANERLVGDSVIDEGICTVTEAVAVAEPDVAVITAVPSETAVTTPSDDTVAMSVSDELHVTAAPAIVAPPASFTVTVRVAVAPAGVSVSEVDDSVIDDAT
jgi:hypothetical protein